jgi:hypothetical protein
MAITLVKLTSIITVMLVVLMSVSLWLGFETHHFESFWNMVQFTGCFLLIVGAWYLIAPPHRATSTKRRKLNRVP